MIWNPLTTSSQPNSGRSAQKKTAEITEQIRATAPERTGAGMSDAAADTDATGEVEAARLEQIPAGSGRAVFVCGRNQDEQTDLFDRVLLLRIGARTQEARLAAHDAAHPPGRNQAGRQEIRQGRALFEAQMIEAGAIALDGTAPTASVASELLALAAAT